MNDKHKSPEPMYSQGVNFIALGQALQDKRTTITELAVLAFDCGLRLRYSMQPEGPSTGEQTP